MGAAWTDANTANAPSRTGIGSKGTAMCNIAHLSAAPAGDRAYLKALVQASIHHFQEFRGAGAGVANGSCCAVMKSGPGPQDFVFGHSQAHNLDPDAPHHGGLFNPDHHAERVVYTAAAAHPAHHNHLFVELPPCASCAAWLQATTPHGFNVWYLYADTESMRLAHAYGTEAELATLDSIL